MGALFWLGGCALGLVLLELTQRRFFPGEPLPVWEWMRRTRRRESIEGGPATWAALFDSSWVSTGDRLAPKIPHDLTDQSSEDEAGLRKRFMEEKRPSSKAVLLCFLADLATRRGDREEARQILSEAEEIISLVWEPHLRQARYVYELVLRLKSLFLFQEGKTEEAAESLNQVEKLFGWREWVTLARAEVALLMDQTRAARALTDQILGSMSRSSGCYGRHLEHSALLLKAESFLRELDLDGLEWTLRKIQSHPSLEVMDRLTYMRFRVELAVSRNDLPAAWRSVSGLHNCLTTHPNHPGIARAYHLCCAKLHQLEENYQESHRRLQLAENLSLHPLGRWEVQVHLASLLESEDRGEEAQTIWARLSQECGETYFGRLARARLARHEPRPLVPAPIFEIFSP